MVSKVGHKHLESDFQKDSSFKGLASLNKARFFKEPGIQKGIKTSEEHKGLCSYWDVVSAKAFVTSRRTELGQHKGFTYNGWGKQLLPGSAFVYPWKSGRAKPDLELGLHQHTVPIAKVSWPSFSILEIFCHTWDALVALDNTFQM